MSSQRLDLPTLQNWSCHSCGGCCRQHLIEITEEERERILKQGWTADDGIPADTPLIRWHAGPPWKKRYRLGHQSDGACVFLDENGLCRIHAKFGEAAKPLACRIYPYAFHPAGKKVAVSLRFSCPSAVANRGKSVSKQVGEIKKIARDVVPDRASDTPAPQINAGERLDWTDFHRFVRELDHFFENPEASVATKILRGLSWSQLIGQAKFDKIRGQRLDEFLGLIREAVDAEFPNASVDLGEPSRIGLMQFRLLVAQYSRRDTLADKALQLTGRLRLLLAAMQFARGKGNVPPLQATFRKVPFEAVEKSFGPLPEEADEIFDRYFRVKIQGLHFCGAAYYGVPLVEGFQSLALIFPAVLWLARWLAASESRESLAADDVSRALAIADHHHGFSPIFGSRNFRRRVRTLARSGDLSRICLCYGGPGE